MEDTNHNHNHNHSLLIIRWPKHIVEIRIVFFLLLFIIIWGRYSTFIYQIIIHCLIHKFHEETYIQMDT